MCVAAITKDLTHLTQAKPKDRSPPDSQRTDGFAGHGHGQNLRPTLNDTDGTAAVF